MKISLSRFSPLALAIGLAVGPEAGFAQTYTLDSFENGLRVVQPNSTDPASKYPWSVYIGGSGTPPTTITTTDKVDGTSSLKGVHGTGSEMQLQFYTYTEALANWDNGWNYARQFVNNPSMNPDGGSPAWPLNRLNRMRFWVKLPAGIGQAHPSHNVEIGTYLRDLGTARNLAESDNQHFYHFLDLRSHGQWEQVIIDTHPDHQRGNAGNTELKENPQIPEPGYNYFDLMTRFYIHVPYAATAGNYLVDGVEFYQETNPENTAQVRSLHAAFLPATSTVEVGWTRNKNENGVNHEVRYSFSPIHTIGWAAATVPSNTVVVDDGDFGYNSMAWVSPTLSLSGKTVLYVAVKPQNSTLFRQIAIPLTSGPVVKPLAPASLIVK